MKGIVPGLPSFGRHSFPKATDKSPRSQTGRYRMCWFESLARPSVPRTDVMEQGCTALSAASLVHRPKYASRTRLVPEAMLPMFERAACSILATTNSSNANQALK
jgi:hypothetical protein